jgi:hypothetical protein
MAGFLFKLERTDGRPAEPSSFSSAVPNWTPGETIHFGHRMVRVVAVRDVDADQPPVLVVEDAAVAVARDRVGGLWGANTQP